MAATRQEREAITRTYAIVTRDLKPSDVIDEMLAEQLLTTSEHEDIEIEKNRRTAARKTLSALQTKRSGSFDKFIRILLRTSGQEQIAEEILKIYTPMTNVVDLPGNPIEEEKLSVAVKEEGSPEPLASSQPVSHSEEESLPVHVPQPMVSSNPDDPQFGLTEYVDGTYDIENETTDTASPTYPMKSNPRGLAIIINNKVFHGRMKKREGTDLDAENLYSLFQWLGFEVKLFHNLTGKKMVQTVKEASKLDFRSRDCLIIAILSHGIEGKLYGTDEELIPVDEIPKYFNGYNCPTLVGKPKIFLLQACRGGTFDYGVEETDSPFEKETAQPSSQEMLKAAEQYYKRSAKEWEAVDGKVQVIPAEADIAVLYATVPGYVSWRNSAFGSWFIKVFVDTMFDLAQKEHFTDILLEVNQRVAIQYTSRDGNKQMPQLQHQLRKKLHFSPLYRRPK